MNKCKNCNCVCHCNVSGHSDNKGVCACGQCSCKQGKAEDSTYENNGGVVIDDTGECESCQ